MKTGLITAAAIASVLFLSATASAGENCPSKGGAHKDMSAAASKDGKDHHNWTASQDAVKAEESAVSTTDAQQAVPAQPVKGVLKI